jgi:hypothetical protein
MSKRQQLPPQIKKIEVKDRKTGKPVVRYQLTLDSGVNPLSGKRQQVRRRYGTEKQARDAMSEIGQQAATDQFVPRKAVTVEELCADWLASLHNARATTLTAYAYALAPLRERHGQIPVQRLTRPDLDRLLTDLRDGGTVTAKGHRRRAWLPRSLNKAVDAWRSALDYGIERRELAQNVAAAMKKCRRNTKRCRPIHLTRSAACCAPPIRTAVGTCGIWRSQACAVVRSRDSSGRTSTWTMARSPSRATACGPGLTSSRVIRKPCGAAHAAARRWAGRCAQARVGPLRTRAPGAGRGPCR